jgi:hypothetical protein
MPRRAFRRRSGPTGATPAFCALRNAAIGAASCPASCCAGTGTGGRTTRHAPLGGQARRVKGCWLDGCIEGRSARRHGAEMKAGLRFRDWHRGLRVLASITFCAGNSPSCSPFALLLLLLARWTCLLLCSLTHSLTHSLTAVGCLASSLSGLRPHTPHTLSLPTGWILYSKYSERTTAAALRLSPFVPKTAPAILPLAAHTTPTLEQCAVRYDASRYDTIRPHTPTR